MLVFYLKHNKNTIDNITKSEMHELSKKTDSCVNSQSVFPEFNGAAGGTPAVFIYGGIVLLGRVDIGVS